MIMVFEEHPFDGSAKKCESAMNTKSLSNHMDISAGFMIFYTSERGLIMKLETRFIKAGLFVRLVFLIKTTAAHNLPCVILFYSFWYIYFPTSFQGYRSKCLCVCRLPAAANWNFLQNVQFCVYCVFILKTYPSWVSIKMFCCVHHSWIKPPRPL